MIFLIAIGYLFWRHIIKRFYYLITYNEDKTGVDLKQTLDKETLMEILDKDFLYPNIKSKGYNEDGNIVLVGEYGEHILKIEGSVVYVGRVKLKDVPNSEQMKNIQEAECMKHYFQKIVNPDYKINLELEYNNMKKSKKRLIISWIIFFIFILVGIMYQTEFNLNDIINIYKSDKISIAYLSDYSTEVTIGEAFEDFFDNTDWKKYKEGIQEYVDFKGNCLFDDERVTIVISFFKSEDYFEISEIKVNGEEIPKIMHSLIISSIYNNSTIKSESNLNKTQNNPVDNSQVSEYKEETYPVDSSYEQSFEEELKSLVLYSMDDYWSNLEIAIYSGYFEDVIYSIYPDSNLYKNQEKLVNSLFNRGIYEEMISNEILEYNFDSISEGEIEIKTKETIRVVSPDKEKTEDYYYTYILKKDDNDIWLPSEIKVTV